MVGNSKCDYKNFCLPIKQGKYIVLDGKVVEYWSSKGWEKIPAIITINSQRKKLKFSQNKNFNIRIFFQTKKRAANFEQTVKLLGKNP